MINIFRNSGYFIKETFKMIKLDLLSAVFSFLSTGFILFILAIVICSWWISNSVIEVIQGDAEINAYYKENMDQGNISQLIKSIEGIDGVRGVRVVDKNEAYDMMVKVLGKEAGILEIFDNNPFSSYIEIRINLEAIDTVIDKINKVTGIEYVRDNVEILSRLKSIVGIIRIAGYFLIAAVGISTLVIISHIIRQGIYNNREQINTLRLLGAPEAFIALPYFIEGIILTLGGGLLASTATVYMLKYIYNRAAGPLPFMPLPPYETVFNGIVLFLVVLSTSIGILGSIIGLSSSKKD